MKKKTKNKKINDDRPVGKLTRVPDFLPAPEELMPPENVTKITITIDVDTIEFFKKVAKKNGTKYQRMMREVLKGYARRFSA
jgi:predicted DNA binding CopG/RHH family protein